MKKLIMVLVLMLGIVGCSKTTNSISKEEAQDIALKEVNGEVIEFHEDENEFEFTIVTDKEKYEIEVSKVSGKIISKEKDDDYLKENQSNLQEPAKPIISEDEAKKIALDKVGGGEVISCILETDDGIKKYDVDVKYNNKKYEVEINADNKEIISYQEVNH